MLANFFVFGHENSVGDFNDRHVDAKVVVKACKLDANRAAADDQQFFRHRLGHHGFAVTPNKVTINF